METAIAWSEIIRNYAIVGIGAIGGVIAIWRGLAADRQSRAARDEARLKVRDYATKSLTEAVAALDSDVDEIRVAALFALKRVALDNSALRDDVYWIVVIFLKRRAVARRADMRDEDVRAAAQIIRDLRRRQTSERR